MPHPSPSKCISVSLHKGKTSPIVHMLQKHITTCYEHVKMLFPRITASTILTGLNRWNPFPVPRSLLCPVSRWWTRSPCSGYAGGMRSPTGQPLNKKKTYMNLCFHLSTLVWLKGRWMMEVTRRMVSSGRSRVNMVCRCCWRSPKEEPEASINL